MVLFGDRRGVYCASVAYCPRFCNGFRRRLTERVRPTLREISAGSDRQYLGLRIRVWRNSWQQ